MIKPLFILFNAVENFFSKKFFSVYLEIKKQTDAPNEEAKAIKSNASKNEKIAPIKIEKAAAKGRDKATIKKITEKKIKADNNYNFFELNLLHVCRWS